MKVLVQIPVPVSHDVQLQIVQKDIPESTGHNPASFQDGKDFMNIVYNEVHWPFLAGMLQKLTELSFPEPMKREIRTYLEKDSPELF